MMEFTLDWYKEQKNQGLSDIEIAESLFVAYTTLQYTKKKHGWTPGMGHKYCGRKQEFDPETIRQLRGLPYKDIMKRVGCSKATVTKYLKRQETE